ncbi:hypothetical protein C8A01DRAFT_38786 [Parachaetomium inaequale]|uniref:Uncharacterized protein n=1 Tax=Parachaetomium inaequale TaxID=2588326 RepID=A0AAN6SPH6_9PEZI|nr:hypothetical protein C8A01DRAFT_38786 [Parachaetomium inaequale]
MELNSGDDLISLKESIQTQCSLSAESPPSIVDAGQYARRSGLTIDSLLFDWQHLVEHDHAITSTLVGLDPGQLIEAAQLQECLFRAIIPAAERWQMPAASLQILQQVCRRSKDDELADLVSEQCFPETLKWESLKLEAPVLRSDHGTNCRRLARRVKTFLKEALPDHRLPLHPVDMAQGEGVEFPESMVRMDEEQMKVVEQESLEVTKNTLVYLMQSLKSDLTDHDQWDFVETVSTYHGVGAREHLTPPLSPLAMAYPEYFVPDDESCEIPEPSVPSSRFSEDLEAAEGKIFESEFQFWAGVLEKDDSPRRYDDIDVSEMIRAGEFRPPIPPSSSQAVPRNLKIDVPLLPCSVDNEAAAEATRILASDDLAEAKELVASSDTLSGSDGHTGQLVTLFQKSATTVMRHAEQEKLQPLDAAVRVTVPVLDFSIPVPEWGQRLWEAKAMFRWIQKDIDVDWQGSKWPHNRTAEQRMVWTPLAHMKERKVTERIEVDNEVLESFLKRTRDGEALTSANYVYKEPGLAVLRTGDNEDDEEDYLTPLNSPSKTPSTDFRDTSRGRTVPALSESTLALQRSSPFTADTATPPPADLTTLLSGRKRLIDETLQKSKSNGKRDWVASSGAGISAMDIIDPALIPSTNVLRGFMSEYTDFAPLVDNFLDMNFPKKPKLTHSSFFTPPKTTPSAAAQFKADEAAKLMPPPPKPIPALAPSITPPQTPPRVVISSSTSQLLIQHLKTLLPTIELIPRTYAKHHPPGWSPGMRSPNLDEADLVVSPATGILLTTMIQLRQRALPSQLTTTSVGSNANANANANNATTFSRIVENVAVRHERLVVLVSEGNKHSETASPLAQADARALAEFQGFAAGLAATTADVQVVYVGGGVETLARWVAAIVCEYAAREVGAVAAGGGVREMLLPVETFWEVFLRRAGMNVFAAQVVLGRLKVPDGRPAVGGGDGQVFGLPLFVMMSRERRIELFAEVLGGRRVLDRVSDVIDEPWGQRAVDGGVFDFEMAPTWGGLYCGIA